jgi:hypothetical protein
MAELAEPAVIRLKLRDSNLSKKEGKLHECSGKIYLRIMGKR